MKIVDRQTFLSLPPGTLYAKYVPCAFGALMIKQATVYLSQTGVAIDWWYQDLIPWFENTETGMGYIDTLGAIQKGQREAPALDYDSESRDGLFDEDQLFAVFEPRDARALIDRLEQAWQASIAPISAAQE